MKNLKKSLIKSYDTNKLIDKIENKYNNIKVVLNTSKSNESLFWITFNNKKYYDNFLEDIYIQRQLDFLDII